MSPIKMRPEQSNQETRGDFSIIDSKDKFVEAKQQLVEINITYELD